jgi:outer membrane protein
VHILPTVSGLVVFALAAVRPAYCAQSVAPAETLTVERALALALESNRDLGSARLEVAKAEDRLAAARTYRLPSFKWSALGMQRITVLDFSFPHGAFGTFEGIGEVPATDTSIRSPRRPGALLIGQVNQPLSQQYRIGLQLGLLRAQRDTAVEQERAQRHAVVAEVKRVYFSILQTQAALESAEEAIRLYRELDRVTGDFVLRQVALKAENLEVKTLLANAEYEALALRNPLETQKEQLNILLGRDVGTAFELGAVGDASDGETDLDAARRLALDRRPEVRQAALKLKQAEADRRVKRSEYIPDLSLSFNYFSPVNYGSLIPANIATVGLLFEWEPFDWGRKRLEVAEKAKTVEQANLSLRQAQAQVAVDVGNRFRKLREARQLLAVRVLARETAQENLRVANNRYKQQMILLKDVLQLQTSLAGANQNYQAALAAYWTARADFEKALGEE